MLDEVRAKNAQEDLPNGFHKTDTTLDDWEETAASPAGGVASDSCLTSDGTFSVTCLLPFFSACPGPCRHCYIFDDAIREHATCRAVLSSCWNRDEAAA